MEDILAIVLIFGGGASVLFAYSPIGRAIAERIRGPAAAPPAGPDPAVFDELERLRAELGEVQERLDFTERMLANRGDAKVLQQPEAR